MPISPTAYNRRLKRGHTAHNYQLAETYWAYGRDARPREGLGDMFGDIMGTIIPGWDSRPEWMKKLVVKPDPAKLLQTASRVVPPKQAGAAIDAANKAGFNFFMNTGAGQVPITGAGVQHAMQYGGGYLNFGNAVSSIPVWVYAAGGVLVLALIMKK